jgi:hypothetical protein
MAGPAGGDAFPLRQQHFARPRQHAEVFALDDAAAIGARKARHRTEARTVATVRRTPPEIRPFTSIPLGIEYNTRFRFLIRAPGDNSGNAPFSTGANIYVGIGTT